MPAVDGDGALRGSLRAEPGWSRSLPKEPPIQSFSRTGGMALETASLAHRSMDGAASCEPEWIIENRPLVSQRRAVNDGDRGAYKEIHPCLYATTPMGQQSRRRFRSVKSAVVSTQFPPIIMGRGALSRIGAQ